MIKSNALDKSGYIFSEGIVFLHWLCFPSTTKHYCDLPHIKNA